MATENSTPDHVVRRDGVGEERVMIKQERELSDEAEHTGEDGEQWEGVTNAELHLEIEFPLKTDIDLEENGALLELNAEDQEYPLIKNEWTGHQILPGSSGHEGDSSTIMENNRRLKRKSVLKEASLMSDNDILVKAPARSKKKASRRPLICQKIVSARRSSRKSVPNTVSVHSRTEEDYGSSGNEGEEEEDEVGLSAEEDIKGSSADESYALPGRKRKCKTKSARAAVNAAIKNSSASDSETSEDNESQFWRNFRCTFCPREFKTRSRLTAHTRSVHLGLREYECDVCRNRFSSRGGLKIHKARHAPVKPYCCDTCGCRFRDRQTLRMHKVVHTGIKAFQCDTCGKKFARKVGLRKHQATHTGLKLFACEICGKKYTTREHVKRHAVTHGPDPRPFKCGICPKEFTQSYFMRKCRKSHAPAATVLAPSQSPKVSHPEADQSQDPRSPSTSSQRTETVSASPVCLSVTGTEKPTPGKPHSEPALTSSNTIDAVHRRTSGRSRKSSTASVINTGPASSSNRSPQVSHAPTRGVRARCRTSE